MDSVPSSLDSGSINKRIFFAVLNWGLGHASRSIPIITSLREMGFSLVLGSDGAAGDLLQQTFPDLPFREMPAYNVTYPSGNLAWHMLRQSVKIQRAIFREHQCAQQLHREFQFDTIISDNRLGVYVEGVRSICITHQLHLKAPARWQTPLAKAVNYRALRRFDEIWIPDFLDDTVNLGGALSHPPLPQPPCYYLGALSALSGNNPSVHPQKVLIVLSGPEPQRTYFEQALAQQLPLKNYSVTLVRGTRQPALHSIPSEIKVFDFLTSEKLADLFAEAAVVVSRTGYSTLMDLATLQKRALLIPTPGQPEQEYLATQPSLNQYFAIQHQHQLDLEQGIAAALEKPLFALGGPKPVLRAFLSERLTGEW